MICLHPEVRTELKRDFILFILWQQSHRGYDSKGTLKPEEVIHAKGQEYALLEELKIRANCLRAKHQQFFSPKDP